tara:strand:+ start:1856 stop:2065 length:210 start_codon:yes stop_codon:yes gene_type:complete
MVIFDDKNERFRKLTHIKWKESLPSISEEQAILCEKEWFEFVNNNKSESEVLKNINEYLISEGLIEPIK